MLNYQTQSFCHMALGLSLYGVIYAFPVQKVSFISIVFLAHEHSGTLPYSSIPLALYTAQLSLWLLVTWLAASLYCTSSL